MGKNIQSKVFYWFDDEYRVTNFEDAGVAMIELLIKRGKKGEKWRTLYHTHTELLRKITEFTSAPTSEGK
jgi:hypothetical protein